MLPIKKPFIDLRKKYTCHNCKKDLTDKIKCRDKDSLKYFCEYCYYNS